MPGEMILPRRCPFCHSRQVVIGTYRTGARYVECEGCWSVISPIVAGRLTRYAYSKAGKLLSHKAKIADRELNREGM